MSSIRINDAFKHKFPKVSYIKKKLPYKSKFDKNDFERVNVMKKKIWSFKLANKYICGLITKFFLISKTAKFATKQ